MGALLMTVVRDKHDDGHAILMVRTDHGDFMLDNLNDEVRSWRQTGLSLREAPEPDRSQQLGHADRRLRADRVALHKPCHARLREHDAGNAIQAFIAGSRKLRENRELRKKVIDPASDSTEVRRAGEARDPQGAPHVDPRRFGSPPPRLFSLLAAALCRRRRFGAGQCHEGMRRGISGRESRQLAQRT